MTKSRNVLVRPIRRLCLTLGSGLLLLSAASAWAVAPEVSTVPWVATNPLISHTIESGTPTRLKGVSSLQNGDGGASVTYSWNPGDGSPLYTGTVSNRFVIEATHTYTGSIGQVFTAQLTVTNTSTGESDSANYFVQIQADTLESDVNIAIDEGLWYLHKAMTRSVTVPTDTGTLPAGHWESCASGYGSVCQGYYSMTPANLTAFEVNGHLENGSASNPYTETVARAMRWTLSRLETQPTSVQTYPAPTGAVNPDGSVPLNGYGIRPLSGQNEVYQGGSFMDAIAASGTPGAIAPTGEVGAGADPGVRGRTYQAIVQDMVDWYAYGQGDNGANRGGWTYTVQNNCASCRTDNSTNQWAAIGMLAAEREFGISIPTWVKTENQNSVAYLQTTSDASFYEGAFGYDNRDYFPWGAYAVTPSGTVQLALDGIGRGDARWDQSERFLRRTFCNTGGATEAIRGYYYGLFSFTKSMLLHDANGDLVPEPITDLTCQPGGYACALDPIDWYAAEASAGDDCDGVARTLVGTQTGAGYWYTAYFDSGQAPFSTAWAIIMLNRTVFSSGQPVAVCSISPNPSVAGQQVSLDGSDSFHQDSALGIVSWEWDVGNNGSVDFTGPLVNGVTLPPVVGQYPIKLTVRDNDNPAQTDDTVCIADVATPPIAPTASAGGPYVLCPNAKPWFLDGRRTVNPDEGLSEPGQPGDTIYGDPDQFAWDLDGDTAYDDAFDQQPNVTAFFEAAGPGDYNVSLQVTDTTATSFPSSGFGDLSGTAVAQVRVREAADPECECIDTLTARPKSGKIELAWTPTGDPRYHVHRATVSGGPYTQVADTTNQISIHVDAGLTNGTPYFYVVRPAALNGDEQCQSEEVGATPTGRIRR